MSNAKKTKTIGMIGGLAYESTVSYYQIINEYVNERLGQSHYPDMLISSLDFGRIYQYQCDGEWDKKEAELIKAANFLESGGADFIVICSNTSHMVADKVQAAISIPLLHIADATAQTVAAQGIKKAALIGTAFTMRSSLYRGRLERLGIEQLTPCAADIETIGEMMKSGWAVERDKKSMKHVLKKIVNKMERRGAQAVILGCTEFGLVLKEGDCHIPMFDSAVIHAEAAARFALGMEK